MAELTEKNISNENDGKGLEALKNLQNEQENKGLDITRQMETMVPSSITTKIEYFQVTGEVVAPKTIKNEEN